MTLVLKSMTAATATPRQHVFSDRQMFFGNIVLSGEYPTGGEISLSEQLEVLLKQTGGGLIDWVEVAGVPGYQFIYNYETNKLQVFESGPENKPLKELPHAEYPAALRNGVIRALAIGS